MPTASRRSSAKRGGSRTRRPNFWLNIARKRQAAEAEAQDIIEGAKAEADRLATEAKGRIEDFVARRTALAETEIAQAEAQATADVRSAAADAAIAAAEKILGAETKESLLPNSSPRASTMSARS